MELEPIYADQLSAFFMDPNQHAHNDLWPNPFD